MKRRKYLGRAVALTLAVVLSVGTTAYAGEVASPTPQQDDSQSVSLVAAQVAAQVAARTEDLNFLYDTLLAKHPNLFANHSESTFLAKKQEIQDNLAHMSDLDFAMELQSLTALVGDSHTTINVWTDPSALHALPLSITQFAEGWVLSAVESQNKAYLGQTLTAVNGHSMEEVLEMLSPFYSHDNDAYLKRQFQQTFNIYELLVHYGVAESGKDVILTLEDSAGKASDLVLHPVAQADLSKLDVVSLTQSWTSYAVTWADRSKYYKFEELDDDTFYIQYNSCQEDPSLPIETFCGQVAEKLNAKNYKKIVIDLRYNGGGSDGVIIPLLMQLTDYVRTNGAVLYSLIGDGTFSSALINAVEIKEAGGVLVGQPTGGSVDHFGEVGAFQLPNSGIVVYHSQNRFELDTLLEAARDYGTESFQPDIVVAQTLADYKAGIDTAAAYIVKSDLSKPEPYASSDLTRAMFVTMLGRLAEQKENATFENATPVFDDVMPFGYYAPYINWAKQTGLVSGTGGSSFDPVRRIKTGEMAIILKRFAAKYGLTLPIPVDQLTPTRQCAESILSAWK